MVIGFAVAAIITITALIRLTSRGDAGNFLLAIGRAFGRSLCTLKPVPQFQNIHLNPKP